MYSVTRSFGLKGLNGFAVAVEADVSGGLPAFSTFANSFPFCHSLERGRAPCILSPEALV